MYAIARTAPLLLIAALLGGALAQTLTVYSGRNEAFIAPVVQAFEDASGVDVQVRYGDTAPLAAQILEEGSASPADVYLAQDAGALGALEDAGRLAQLPNELLERVDARFRSDDGRWVGVTGRARVLVVREGVTDVPDSVFELTDEAYRGRVGWAPTNGSFQAFVTAMRVAHGDERTESWLRGMIANDARSFPNNSSQVEAAGRGEIDFGLVNHYYLSRFTSEDPDFPARNEFLPDADIGSLVNVAGVAVLETSERDELAHRFVAFLLSDVAQRHFTGEVNEYPLVAGVEASEALVPLDQLETPDLDLSDLADLEGTLELLQETGALR